MLEDEYCIICSTGFHSFAFYLPILYHTISGFIKSSQQISCKIETIQWTGFLSLTLGVINHSEPESHLMGAESYEGQPVCDTLQKNNAFSQFRIELKVLMIPVMFMSSQYRSTMTSKGWLTIEF